MPRSYLEQVRQHIRTLRGSASTTAQQNLAETQLEIIGRKLDNAEADKRRKPNPSPNLRGS